MIFVYPGTFDPFTNGHTDIVKRAINICDKLYVTVMVNKNKKTYFTLEERIYMAEKSLEGLEGVVIESYDGLLVDYFKEKKAVAVVRGLRSESDFRFEAELTAANKILLPEYETVLMPSSTELAFTSSTIVREVASFGGDVSGMVLPDLAPMIVDKLRSNNNR